jgi:hypothetical protein
VLPATGPYTSAPLALSNTAKLALTHCTYCVAPTAPVVSGGAYWSRKLPRPTPMPSNPTPLTVAAVVPARDCTTGSLACPGASTSGMRNSRTRCSAPVPSVCAIAPRRLGRCDMETALVTSAPCNVVGWP